jgi:hypothetical protein
MDESMRVCVCVCVCVCVSVCVYAHPCLSPGVPVPLVRVSRREKAKRERGGEKLRLRHGA